MIPIKPMAKSAGDSGTFGSQKTMNSIKAMQTKTAGLNAKKQAMASKLTASRPATLRQYITKR